MKNIDALEKKEQKLQEVYGHLLTLDDIAGILRYPSSESVLKAHHRGSLPIKLIKFPKRKGFFTTPKIMAAVLIGLEEENLMT